MGASAGVGKSTFASELGKKLSINVYHLDILYWKPGWVESSLEEFRFKQDKIVKLDQWTMDGNYSNTYDLRAHYVDTIIYLELLLMVCLYRVFKRYILNIGITRPDMREGCTEKLDYNFIKFVITTNYPRKKKMIKRLKKFREINHEIKIVRLTNNNAIKSFLNSISS